ncbi:MAG: response regulator [Ktedonobacterales bacterium]
MSDPSAQPRTVLLVDDNTELLFLLTTTLEKLGGFRVVTAENGADALHRYFEAQPDCMVIDVKMPGLDGYQLVRALRGDPASAQTPLIILSAMVQEKDQLAGLVSGADEYLLKPVKPLDLIEMIQRVIGVSRADRQRRMQQLADGDTPTLRT